ncbi:MAG: hypothetical protein JO257_22960 [Deltaproteobacteria bacterium]|nr:hypothetical protein [Deltaproteobacteria bacterium]
MRARSGGLFVVALVVCGLVATGVADKDNKFGVGFVPHMDAGDKTEQMLHRFVGEMPEVDQIFDINDGEHMLKTLIKLKKQGKKLDYLVLAAHGSRETPGMKWANDDMIPEEINLAWQKEQLSIAKRLKAAGCNTTERTKVIDERIRSATAQIKLLEQIPGVMKPNGLVLMINCSAAATPNGRAYVDAFGKLLLGPDGGHIIASTTDIRIREVSNIYEQVGELVRHGETQSWGEPFIDGSWITVPIAKGSSNKLEDIPAAPEDPYASPAAPSGCEDVGVFVAKDIVMVGTRADVEAYPTCRVAGWGVDCKRTLAGAVRDGGIKSIDMIEGPFKDRAAACKKYRELLKDGKFEREKIRTDYVTGC